MTEVPSPEILRLAAQKRRNLWLALALVVFVVLVGVTTTLRIQDADFSGENGFYFSGKMPDMTESAAESPE